jgi:hypothetical protein
MAKETTVFECENCKKFFPSQADAQQCEAQHHINDLAEKLHSHFCRYNHIDGCDHDYAIVDTGNNRSHWQEKWTEIAEKVDELCTSKGADLDILIEFGEILKKS